MAIKIPYTAYKFIPPKPLTDDEFISLKETEEYKFKMTVKDSNKREYKKFINMHPIIHYPAIISLYAMLIGFLFIFILVILTINEIEIIENPDFIGVLIAFSLPGVLIGAHYLFTYKSFKKYLRDKKSYLLRQKKFVDKQQNYSDYLRNIYEIRNLTDDYWKHDPY